MHSIVLFRNDLRVIDHLALCHAQALGSVTCAFVYEAEHYGSAANWWLHHSLTALQSKVGGLTILAGNPLEVVPKLVAETGAEAVFWNRRYEPDGIAQDTALKAKLKAHGTQVQSFAGNLLFEPWEVRTKTGGPYKVFTPFWRTCLEQLPQAPKAVADFASKGPQFLAIEDLALCPTTPDWAGPFSEHWTPGEDGAFQRLREFLDVGLSGYKTLRDRPDLPNVSRLAPHLHFGELSPRQVWTETQKIIAQGNHREDARKFLAEIGWREFSHHLLFHFPTLPNENLNRSFDAYPWEEDAALLKAWQRGQTGYPLVDAGMRELWATGYMHNRVRMVVASFLIKHLRQDWRKGAAWFWDTLLDADLANNSASWQWVAGCGADAAPYFRIFNPTTQAQKFDPNGSYIRQWCPELAALPDKSIHAPWEAPELVLQEAGVRLGQSYPLPIVDHKLARAAALMGYDQLKSAR